MSRANETVRFHLYVLILCMSVAGTLSPGLYPSVPTVQAQQDQSVKSYDVNSIPDGYHVETIPVPEHVGLEVGGMDFAPNGDLYICTRWGEVWRYRPSNGRGSWDLFAEGLDEPLGIHVDADAGNRTVYVVQRPELTRLVDTTGNGWADQYQTVTAEWGYSQNYHAYAFGLPQSKDGTFYITLNLGTVTVRDLGLPGRIHGSPMVYSASDRGTTVRVKPDGSYEVFAYGFRSPAGITLDPDTGDVFVTDNQGDWVPTSSLMHVEKGKFYGHPASLEAHPDFSDKTYNDLDNMSTSAFRKRRTRPAVWFPHGVVASSPGEPVFNNTGGQFGPFEDQIFVGDQNLANVSRVRLEQVKGAYQGVVFPFAGSLQSGVLRGAFDESGRLWLGQTRRGWGSVGSKDYGLQRIVYDGETIPFAMNTIRARPNGFEIAFTKPVNRKAASDPASYKLEHWHYKYHGEYGSDPNDRTSVTPDSAQVSKNGKRVRLKLPDMVRKRVYKISVNVDSASGESMSTKNGYYTLNHIPEEQ